MPATLTQADLATKLQDLGHQYLTAARAQDMIVTAVNDVILEELWPMRRQAVTLSGSELVQGGANSSLGPIDQVVDFSQGPSIPRVLEPRRLDWLRDQFGDLTTVGPPRYYGVYWNLSRVRVIQFYPVTVTSVQVVHFSERGWVNGGAAPLDTSDVPVWPATHYELLMARARSLAYEDIDDYDAAAQQEAKYQRRLDLARQQVLMDQWDESLNVTVTQDLV